MVEITPAIWNLVFFLIVCAPLPSGEVKLERSYVSEESLGVLRRIEMEVVMARGVAWF